MTELSVAIIIPTRDRPDALGRCLGQIFPYVAAHPECTIVVSDDGDASQTEGALAAEFPGVRVVQGPRRGPAANRNCGAAHAQGDLLIFLDDDCRPEPNLVAEYQRAAAAEPECSVFEGRTSAEGGAPGFGHVAPENETGGHLWSCNFAIRRRLFDGVGGFDERFPFPAMEDIEFRFRVSAQSPLRFVPGARVFHAYERRVGWRVTKHHSLSFVLYMHLHGLKQTGMGPAYQVKAVAHLAAGGLKQLLRGKDAEDPLHLLYTLITNSELAIITVFWRFHALLARIFYPACCTGCETIHAALAGSSEPAPARAAVNQSIDHDAA
jgi:GT2 family glycosyltransferase